MSEVTPVKIRRFRSSGFATSDVSEPDLDRAAPDFARAVYRSRDSRVETAKPRKGAVIGTALERAFEPPTESVTFPFSGSSRRDTKLRTRSRAVVDADASIRKQPALRTRHACQVDADRVCSASVETDRARRSRYTRAAPRRAISTFPFVTPHKRGCSFGGLTLRLLPHAVCTCT